MLFYHIQMILEKQKKRSLKDDGSSDSGDSDDDFWPVISDLYMTNSL